jgi:hypothetical protein
MVIVIALLVMVLLSVVGAALIVVSSSETAVAANFRNAHEALYAADAAAERAIGDLAATADWTQVLSGTVRSSFADGLPSGTRTRQGVEVDLDEAVNLANCGKATSCTDAEMDAVTSERRWGPNNPRWRLFAFGPLNGLLPAGRIDSPFYGIVLVGDDPSETDNDPQQDGSAGRPGSGVVLLRAQAAGPASAYSAVQLTIGRTVRGNVRVISWQPLR